MNDNHATEDMARDDELAQLLQEMLDQQRDGFDPDVETILVDHPHLADELRELWATLQVAENLGGLARADVESIVDQNVTAYKPEPTSPSSIGDFVIIEELGRGGMGVVYRARQQSLDRIVALKMILRGEFASSEDLQRFRTEAEAIAKLNHPHIVPLHEFGDFRGQPYFSMQFIHGKTLSQRLMNGPLTSTETAQLLVPICRAIAEAHRHGIFHRDLKPSNILIDRDGRPYVTDFGLAKRIDVSRGKSKSKDRFASVTDTGAIIGTPSYMAPEQAAGQRGQVGPYSDVYSLGAVLYACVTGRAPFQAATPVDTLFMVLEQDPVPPRVINRKVDPDLEMIILKCLQKPADLRYESAARLADDLEAYLANESISARTSRFNQIVSRAFRATHNASVLENWGLLWMLHAAVLLVLCFVTNYIHFRGEEQRWPYLALWTVGLGAWAAIFWNLRHRGGPVTFVERQIAHVWAGSMACSTLLYLVEGLLGLPVLTLSPILGLLAGMVFLVKAGILSGEFYFSAIALFLTSLIMAVYPDFSVAIFGVVSGLSFFIPGLKFYRIKKESA